MSKPWKTLEQRVGRTLPGGKRVSARGVPGPDVVSGQWICECKLRASHAHHRTFRTEQAKRKKDLQHGKRFVMATREKGQHLILAVLPWADFCSLVGQELAPEEVNPQKKAHSHHQGHELTLPGLGTQDTTGPE